MVLPEGTLELEGRITTASNATFLGHITGDDGAPTTVVYKPQRGEKPLWDFPDHTLAQREVAAYLLSEALGWNVVPPTWLRDGPYGTGMVQLWQEIDPDQDPVDLVSVDEVSAREAAGWRHILDGVDATDTPVALIHEDTPELRRMAIFDVLANNADRKGAHVLAMPGGHRFGVDHGLTFHVEPRLRTVLWGWLGEPLTDAELAAVTALRTDLDGELGDRFDDLLSVAEVAALARRCETLLSVGRFPGPAGEMPAVPWPLF